MPKKKQDGLPDNVYRHGDKYIARFKVKGHKEQSKVFRKITDCKLWLAKQRTAVASPGYQDLSALQGLSVREVLDEYLKNITPLKAPSALSREASRIKLLKVAFPHQTVATLSVLDVEAFIAARRVAEKKPATIHRDIDVLHGALQMATRGMDIKLPTKIVMDHQKHLLDMKIMDARTRRFKGNEEERLMEALRFNPLMQQAVVLLLETAMRRDELCRAKHSDIKDTIDEDGKPGRVLVISWHKTKGKTRMPREVPLTVRAQEVIAQLPVRSDGRLIGLRPDSMTQAFARACNRAGIEGMRLHDLRHEATSRLVERMKTEDLSLPEIQLITGHRDLRSFARYTNLKANTVAGKFGVAKK